jgi:signal transduction histidine kinase
MWLDHLSLQLLTALSTLFGVASLPVPDENWSASSAWVDYENGLRFEAESEKVVENCANNPLAEITFPVVVHAAHTIKLDGRIISTYGDPTHQRSAPFYGSPTVACRMVAEGKVLSWTVYSYSHYFARLTEFPKLHSGINYWHVFNESMNTIAGGFLWLMALFSFILFRGKVPVTWSLSLTAANLFFGAYLITTTALAFGLEVPTLILHKIADCSIWLGSLAMLNGFRQQGLIGNKLYMIFVAECLLGIVVISFGNTGDAIQLGTMIPCPGFFAVVGYLVWNQLVTARTSGWKRHQTLRLVTLTCFTFGALNDFFVVSGVIENVTLLSFGFVFGMLAFTLDFDEIIINTFRERDFLRSNLEEEVQRKTSELQVKTEDLEKTLRTLRDTQSEFVQNAKMASLGTLSAGIAHEINNSLNYVYGSLRPLEKLVTKGEFTGQKKALVLFKVMSEGLTLTFDIMKSLRTYSGLNHASYKDYNVRDLVKSVHTIVRGRLSEGVSLTQGIPEDLNVLVNGAALNQVLMNLIINASDACDSQGVISIAAGRTADDVVWFEVTDNGSGIDEKTCSRIFEPFFTTKDVGSGTGLGLHICKSEIEKMGGSITVLSQLDIGTTFRIEIPQITEEVREAA